MMVVLVVVVMVVIAVMMLAVVVYSTRNLFPATAASFIGTKIDISKELHV